MEPSALTVPTVPTVLLVLMVPTVLLVLLVPTVLMVPMVPMVLTLHDALPLILSPTLPLTAAFTLRCLEPAIPV